VGAFVKKKSTFPSVAVSIPARSIPEAFAENKNWHYSFISFSTCC